MVSLKSNHPENWAPALIEEKGNLGRNQLTYPHAKAVNATYAHFCEHILSIKVESVDDSRALLVQVYIEKPTLHMYYVMYVLDDHLAAS